jgi:hypothetical protein
MRYTPTMQQDDAGDWVPYDHSTDALKSQIEKLRKMLEEERELFRRSQHPEPYRIGNVYGIKGGVRYVLQIDHVWHEYPDMAIQVFLP